MYRLINKLSIMIAVSLTVVLLSGCSSFYAGNKDEEKLVSDTGFYFDTVIQLSIVHDNGEVLLDECFLMCQELENIFSKTKEDSELYKVNHRTENQLVVSDDLAYVIGLGLEYGELTEGAFDITICPLSDLWDFKSENPVIPSEEEIRNSLEKIDYRKVHLEKKDENENQKNILTFEEDYTMLDLGAIAKGYAADKLKSYLTAQGVESGYINLGGNVLTIGVKTNGESWNIGIQEPFADRGTVLETVEVNDQSVVSSGIYERYFEMDGKIYHHVLNPKTGYPVETDLDQITVVCDESAVGDVVSTSCLLLGEESAKALMEESGFSNIWLHLNDRCAMIKQ